MISSVRNFSVRILDANRFKIVIFQILDIKSNYLPGIVHVMNIKFLVFWLKHQHYISRIPVIGKVTVALVQQWRDQSVFEDDYEVTITQPFIDEKDWPKMMEEIYEFLAANHGEQGNLLSYVIRPNAAVPTEADDSSAWY
jgi:hypothetical protein